VGNGLLYLFGMTMVSVMIKGSY